MATSILLLIFFSFGSKNSLGLGFGIGNFRASGPVNMFNFFPNFLLKRKNFSLGFRVGNFPDGGPLKFFCLENFSIVDSQC